MNEGLEDYTMAYLYYINIFPENKSEHLTNITAVFERPLDFATCHVEYDLPVDIDTRL